MALAPDGTLNMKKLQKEMVEALDEDVKHVKTDEMKKRAIRTARNYDEFKNLVACACLKPITREEIDSLRKAKKGWANARHKSKASGGRSGAAAQLSAPAGQPTSAMEFERDWRRIGAKDLPRRLRLLSMCGSTFIEENFKVEMDAVLLGEVLEALHTALLDRPSQGVKEEGEGGTLPTPPPREASKNQDGGSAHPPPPPPLPSVATGDEGKGKDGLTLQEVGGLMRALAKTGRFSLNKRFLSDVQLKKAGEVVEGLRGQVGEEEVEKLLREYS